ncbi:hypothetical protein [Nonomuraea sp. NPDC049784]|uniref:hypothetical protein n=1 Tax=Nonomuraea sp. NPDC049784 TaxID=3154361 RepID=UPI0033D9CAE3
MLSHFVGHPSTRSPLWRRLKWISAILWIGSWSVVYREIFHWHHMTTSLRFNPPAPPPGTNIQPRPGLPLLSALAAAAIAPIVFIVSVIMDRVRRRPSQIHRPDRAGEVSAIRNRPPSRIFLRLP